MRAYRFSPVLTTALLPTLASRQAAPHTRRVPETKIIFDIAAAGNKLFRTQNHRKSTQPCAVPAHGRIAYMESVNGGMK